MCGSKKCRILTSILILICFGLIFQNCGRGFRAIHLNDESSQDSPTVAPTSTATATPTVTATATATATPRPTATPTATPTPVPTATATSTPVPTPTGTPDASVAPTLSRTNFMTGLENPWDMAFLPDGTMFYTEKCRGLSVRRTDGGTTRLFGISGSILVAPDFFCEGQSGAHGVAVDPNFASNRFVYVYMPSNILNPRTNRVVRLTVNAGFTSVSNRTDIITDIAFKHVGNAHGGSGSHSGGRIRFGPDGFLYVTTGDNHNGPLPQDLTRLGGKVLRVTRDGAAAPGNNTPSGGNPRIFTYGHRNVQGISFRPGTGQPFISEHGPRHHDEVTPLVAGGNGGWDPKPEAGVSCADNYCGYDSNKADGSLTPMTDLPKFPNAMRPTWDNGGSSQGTGPTTWLDGPQWKLWNGRLMVGIMGATRIVVLQINAQNQLVGSINSGLPSERARSLVQGPDGNLYVAAENSDVIWRVVPQ